MVVDASNTSSASVMQPKTPIVSRLYTCSMDDPGTAASVQPPAEHDVADPAHEELCAAIEQMAADPDSERCPSTADVASFGAIPLAYAVSRGRTRYPDRGSSRSRWRQVTVQCLASCLACLLIYAAICLTPFSRRLLAPETRSPTLPPVLTEGNTPSGAPTVLDLHDEPLPGPALSEHDVDGRAIEIMARLDGCIEPYTRH